MPRTHFTGLIALLAFMGLPASAVAADAPQVEDPPQVEDAPAAPAEGSTEAATPEIAPAPKSHAGIQGIKLPGGIRLNGRFDIAYERSGYTKDPADGVDRLRNFHHFVFLSRSADDPFFFSAEIIDQTFYEIGARIRPKGKDWSATFRAGKILVPFGPEPLFHHNYGGLGGFDQELLPLVWAQLGGSASLTWRFQPVQLRADIYMVHGHELEEQDAILDLRGDFSSLSKVRMAFGGRLSASWGPLTLNYSAYFNKLGFDRRLFLQAVDLTVYRIPDVPFLKDLALSLGFMRADISGAGDVADYYHFGDYLELRYFPADWVNLHYRAGLKTLDNREGVYIDERRLGQEDRSAHTLGVTFRLYGASLAVQHTWRLEKKDELADDFFRITLAYDF